MKALTLALFLFFSLLFAPAAQAAELTLVSSGYVEGFFYPKHNEYDPAAGVAFENRIVARYGLEVYTEVRPKNSKVFVFAQPFFLFGDNLPQIRYNYDTDPIAVQIRYGIGYDAGKNISVRVTHSEWRDLGKYAGERLLWSSVSVRYKW